MSLEDEAVVAAAAEGGALPLVVVAPGNDVTALEKAISLCCTAGVFTLPAAGVLVLPEAVAADCVQRGRLLSWEREARDGVMVMPEHVQPGTQDLWWLSFVDEDLCDPDGQGKPGGPGFLGVSIVAANSYLEAVRTAHHRGCNPGGQVQGFGPIPVTAVPERYLHRLLTFAEGEEVNALFVAAQQDEQAAEDTSTAGSPDDGEDLVMMLIEFDEQGVSRGKSYVVQDAKTRDQLRVLASRLGEPLTDASSVELNSMYRNADGSPLGFPE